MVETNNNELMQKLVEGQKRLGGDVSGLKSDVSELKSDVSELKSDVSELKSDVSELKSDVSELKSDVSELKIDVSELKEGQRRVENIVINMEHSLVTKVNALFDVWTLISDYINTTKDNQNITDTRLDDHELRILNLEKSKQ